MSTGAAPLHPGLGGGWVWVCVSEQNRKKTKNTYLSKKQTNNKNKKQIWPLSLLSPPFFFFLAESSSLPPSLPPSPHNYYRWTAAASSAKPSWGAKKETWKLVVSTHFTQIRLLRFNHGLALAATLTAVYIHNEPPHTVQHPSRYSFIYYIYIYTHTYIDIQNIYIYIQRETKIGWRSDCRSKNTALVRVQKLFFFFFFYPTISLKWTN